MFEIKLNENYEDNFHYRDLERANKDAQERADFRKQLRKLQKSRSVSNSLVQKDRNISRNEVKSALGTKPLTRNMSNNTLGNKNLGFNKFYLGQKSNIKH